MKLKLSMLMCFLFLTSLLNQSAHADSGYQMFPAQLHLDGQQAAHRMIVERIDDGIDVGVAGDEIVLESQDPKIARIEGRSVIAVADGTTVVSAKSGDDIVARVPVAVTNTTVAFTYSFRNHVQSVLTKQGCNMGACHGALAGKGGFRLSLRAYDPERDFFNITRQQVGRRVDLTEPALSLFLTKPTMAVPHTGGLRLKEESPDYQVIANWIANGAPGPSSDDATIQSLSVFPEAVRLTKNQQQPFLIQAHYSDGRTEDVTRWTRFASSNEAVAIVDVAGLADVVGPGEGAITASFGSRVATARVTSPFSQSIPDDVYAKEDRSNFIDRLVLDQLQQLRLAPSPVCTDEVFVRRAFLDTTGSLPTAERTKAFLENQNSDKRAKLVDELLNSSEFVDYWTYHWSDLLMLNGALLRPDAVQAYYKWIADRVERNIPWDEFVREIVTARGSSIENGATNFYALHQTPEDMAENVSQAFLGLSIGCAKCHNHPLEKWTNDQYYAFANLFSRVRAKGWGGDSRNGDGKRTLVTVHSGELIQPRTGKPQPPAALDQPPLDFDAPTDRRQKLADWLVSKDNSLFARSITNRVWSKYMGIGLVEDVDDMRASNPASNEKLLTALSGHLVRHDFDLKTLMKQILLSQTYQRSSKPTKQNAGDDRYYSRYYPRRLMAEVMLDAVSSVTEVPSTFNKIEFPGADVRDTKFYPDGTRAIQLYDSAVSSYFLKTFGRNQRRITCECERSDEPSMVQVLHLANGDTVNGKLAAKDNRLQKLLGQYPEDHSKLIEELFLAGLSRSPTKAEQPALVKALSEADDDHKREVLEDITWAMMSSREFLFNH